jgi:hypothetical protein
MKQGPGEIHLYQRRIIEKLIENNKFNLETNILTPSDQKQKKKLMTSPRNGLEPSLEAFYIW